MWGSGVGSARFMSEQTSPAAIASHPALRHPLTSIWGPPNSQPGSFPQFFANIPAAAFSHNLCQQFHSNYLPKIRFFLFSQIMGNSVFGDSRVECQSPKKGLRRLGICQKIYTTQFSGKRILHTKNE